MTKCCFPTCPYFCCFSLFNIDSDTHLHVERPRTGLEDVLHGAAVVEVIAHAWLGIQSHLRHDVILYANGGVA